MIKNAMRRSFRALGLDIRRFREDAEYPPDFQIEDTEIIRAVREWTMTSSERIYALIQAVRYVSSNFIPGAIVECGVWKGGSMAAIARTLLQAGNSERELYLFDTFDGMTTPTAEDLEYSGRHAKELLQENPGLKCDDAPLAYVMNVLEATNYPTGKLHFISGRVEETIPEAAPELIALLRLDTDWYQSTKHELVHLFPRVSRGGVILIDDYGHWRGSQKACDEYFAENRVPILLNRIDYTGRIALKL